MVRKIGFLFGLMASLALPCVASAQNPQPAQPHEPHPSVAPPNASQPPPEQIAPPDSAPGTAGARRRSRHSCAAAAEQPGHNVGDTPTRHSGGQWESGAEIAGDIAGTPSIADITQIDAGHRTPA